MKIMIIQPLLEIYGGAELVVVRLTQELLKSKHEVEVVTSALNYKIRRELKNNINVITKVDDIIKYIKESDYDIYNPHNHPAEMLFKGLTKSVVWNCNEPPDSAIRGDKLPPDYIKVVNNISEVVVSDNFNKNRFRRLYGKDSNIIPYGVDHSFFSKSVDTSFREDNKVEDSFLMLHSSWMNPYKHPERSFEVLNNVIRYIPEAKLVFTGVPDARTNNIFKMMYESPLRNNIVLIGYVNRNKLREIYQSVDIVLCPFEKQGGWLTPLESISSNKLVILHPDAPSASYMRRHNLCIVNADFEKYIIKYYKNKKSFNTLIRNSSKFVETNLTWNNYCKNMLDVYMKALK